MKGKTKNRVIETDLLHGILKDEELSAEVRQRIIARAKAEIFDRRVKPAKPRRRVKVELPTLPKGLEWPTDN